MENNCSNCAYGYMSGVDNLKVNCLKCNKCKQETVDFDVIRFSEWKPLKDELPQAPLSAPEKGIKHDKGALNYDKGKERVELVTGRFIRGVGQVCGMGAEKYSDDNWRAGMDWRRVLGSMSRHLTYLLDSDDIDAESGVNHELHIAFRCMQLYEYRKYHQELDNRWKKEEADA